MGKYGTIIIVNGVWLSLARAPGLGPGGRRFESCHPDSAPLAQLEERLPCKQDVGGSSPSRSFRVIVFDSLTLVV